MLKSLAGSILSFFLFKNKVRGGISKAITNADIFRPSTTIASLAVTCSYRWNPGSQYGSRLNAPATQTLPFFPDDRLCRPLYIASSHRLLLFRSSGPCLCWTISNTKKYGHCHCLRFAGLHRTLGWLNPSAQCQVCPCLLFMRASG